MGDMGDLYDDLREDRKRKRAEHGVKCPRCKEVRPRAQASILLPGQRCQVDGYRDLRPRSEQTS